MRFLDEKKDRQGGEHTVNAIWVMFLGTAFFFDCLGKSPASFSPTITWDISCDVERGTKCPEIG
jgi:hypothetical protein